MLDKQEQRQEQEAVKSAKEQLNRKLKKTERTVKIVKAIVKAKVAILLSLKIFLILGTILSFYVLISSIFDGGSTASAQEPSQFSAVGTPSAFGTEITREAFIAAVEAYNSNSSNYNTYMKPYADEFYDICTEYGVNPCLAFAHSCLETGHGSNDGCKNDKNYFGYAHYNTANSGASYDSVEDSIRAYCEWVKDGSTEGTSSYKSNYEKGKEYAQYNNKLVGTPANNIYVLYCRYAYLGDYHICNEPNFNSPAGTVYYEQQGSNWGTGGRIYIHYMYELGGLYTGRYAELCNHKYGSDETTIQERADYQEYTTNKRINLAKQIFGDKAFILQNSVSTNYSHTIRQLINMTDEQVWSMLTNGLITKRGDKTSYTADEITKSMNFTAITVPVRMWKNPNNPTDMTRKETTIKLTVNTVVAQLFTEFFNDLYKNAPDFVIRNYGAYNPRKGDKTTGHFYGVAIDLNSDTEGNGYSGWPGARGPFTYEEWQKLPENHTKYETIYKGSPMVEVMHKYTLSWGGEWRSSYDGMHFSFISDWSRAELKSKYLYEQPNWNPLY